MAYTGFDNPTFIKGEWVIFDSVSFGHIWSMLHSFSIYKRVTETFLWWCSVNVFIMLELWCKVFFLFCIIFITLLLVLFKWLQLLTLSELLSDDMHILSCKWTLWTYQFFKSWMPNCQFTLYDVMLKIVKISQHFF